MPRANWLCSNPWATAHTRKNKAQGGRPALRFIFSAKERKKRHRRPAIGQTPCGVRNRTLRKVFEYSAASTRVPSAECAGALRTPPRSTAPSRARPCLRLSADAVKKRIRACTNAYHRMSDFYRFPTSIKRANKRPSLVSLADIENRKRKRTSGGMELSQKFPTFAIGGEDNSVQNKMRKRRSGMVWSTFNPPRKESLNKLPYEKYPVPVVHLSIRPDEKSCSI